MRSLLSIAIIVSFSEIGFAATMTEQVESAAKSGKYTYVMFYLENDTATQDMASTVKSHVAETSDKTTWVAVNIRDRNEARLVQRFDASRIPLPAAFCVAANGAVTGVYQQKVNREQLTNAILTPMYCEMVKALQSRQVAVVCLMPDANTPIPAGVTALQQDPAFKGRIHQVKASATDSSEAEFFRRMRVNRKLRAPVVLLFAPPGTHLGTFRATATGQELAQKLHQSGRCTCRECQKRHGSRNGNR